MIYDAVADRAIVFGGENYTDYSNMYRNETFALALGGISTWSKLLPIGVVGHFDSWAVS
jgi:ABC-type taurine transport system ATPase subunit